jgi:surfeit locus 1 family protein
MLLFRLLFNKRRLLFTLLVFAGVGVMIRLGIWQLDRLEQRRSFNQQVLSVQDLPPLDLATSETRQLADQLYRQATARGEFDYEHQVILSNQSYRDQLGVHLLTPLRLENSDRFVLVDRGWVPFEDYQQDNLDRFIIPGEVTATGILAESATRLGVRDCLAETGTAQSTLVLWCVNLEAIQASLPYPLEPLYLIRQPEGASEAPPIGTTVKIEITEGPHLGYAVQWFSFAGLLAIGYPIFLYKDYQARQKRKLEEAGQISSTDNADLAQVSQP